MTTGYAAPVAAPQVVQGNVQTVERVVEVPQLMQQEVVRQVPVPQVQTVEKTIEDPHVLSGDDTIKLDC